VRRSSERAWRGAAAALLACLALASAGGSARGAGGAAADEAEDERLQLIRQRREDLEREVERLRRRERSLLGEVERLELEVRLHGEKLREVRAVLRQVNAEMDVLLARLEEIEGQIEATRPVLAARARSLYKLGELSYLRLLLSVDRPSDFLRGYRFVTTLARRDNERFAGFQADRRAAEETRAELERRTAEAMELRGEVGRARRRLDAQRRRKTELLTEIVGKKESQAAYVAELEQAERQLEELLAGFGEGQVTLPIAAFRGSLPRPVEGPVRAGFGRRRHARFDTYTVHNGIEIEADAGTPVGAVHEGTVLFADRFQGYGLMIVLDHGSKHHSLYAHLEEAAVRVGDRVETGQQIGTVGSTSLDGPGLYFELRFRGQPENPTEWLEGLEGG
jgi:septal ring factor EnvC (AmiA/AmiB activator)